jgi:hypothetical protein
MGNPLPPELRRLKRLEPYPMTTLENTKSALFFLKEEKGQGNLHVNMCLFFTHCVLCVEKNDKNLERGEWMWMWKRKNLCGLAVKFLGKKSVTQKGKKFRGRQNQPKKFLAYVRCDCFFKLPLRYVICAIPVRSAYIRSNLGRCLHE